MAKYKVKIKGTTELLMNKPPLTMDPEELQKRTPRDMLYRDPEGKICIPSICLRGLIHDGIDLLKMPEKEKKLRQQEMTWALRIRPTFIPLKTGKKDPEEAWTAFSLRATRRTPPVLVTRPLFPKWELEFEIEVDKEAEEIWTKETLLTVLSLAGRRIGLLEARKIGFGRFEVTSLEESR